MNPMEVAAHAVGVLVVDDDPQMASLICAMAAMRGCAATAVGDFGSAVVELTRNRFSVVFLDLILPDSALEVTLRSIPRLVEKGAHNVVVITAANLTAEMVSTALRCGAAGVIEKKANLNESIDMALQEAACAERNQGAACHTNAT